MEGSLISGILSQMAGRHETNRFFGGFTHFVVPFFASRQSLCTWHGYFEKTSVLACFFWLQGPLMQSSAAPQGSPPPTQQIKIQMQISWVGWSTNHMLSSLQSFAWRCTFRSLSVLFAKTPRLPILSPFENRKGGCKRCRVFTQTGQKLNLQYLSLCKHAL